MDFLRGAATVLYQNYRPVLLYMGFAALLKIAEDVFHQFVIAPVAESTPDSRLGLYLIATRIVLVALFAFADTIFLSRIGREVDKPYWRVPDDREAIARFYRLWLLLGLLNLFYGQVLERFAVGPENSAAFLLGIGYFLWAALLYALGTTIMFYGQARRDEVQQAFATMSRHAQLVMGLCLFGIVAGVVLSTVNGVLLQAQIAGPAKWAVTGALAMVDGYISCLLFAFMWLVCIYDRDHYEPEPEDFDL